MRLFAKRLTAGELSMGSLFIKGLQEMEADESDESLEQVENEN
jgi:hypothetical protein